MSLAVDLVIHVSQPMLRPAAVVALHARDVAPSSTGAQHEVRAAETPPAREPVPAHLAFDPVPGADSASVVEVEAGCRHGGSEDDEGEDVHDSKGDSVSRLVLGGL